jgi:hypothetical protein
MKPTMPEGCSHPEDLIAAEFYAIGSVAFKTRDHPSLGTLTICTLVLKNGFTVTSESNCVNPEEFDPGLGQLIAREKAVDKIWQLQGYLMKEQRYRLQRELAHMEKHQG